MSSSGVRRQAKTVGVIGVMALASMTLLGGASAVGSTATPAAAPLGVAQSFVSVGLCDGGPRYRVELHNSGDGTRVVAELRVTRAGARAVWSYSGSATSALADGTKVTLITDFGRPRSNRDGVLRLRQSTPAGTWHSIEFALERRSDDARCLVVVRG